MNTSLQPVVVICGPTSSGKTSLALLLAKELGRAIILSVDSRQMYKDLDLVTGKDTPYNLSSKIKIFGQSIFSPENQANLADYIQYARKIITYSKKTNIPLIIVGGTGLYLKALTQDFFDVSIPPDPSLRQELEKLSLKTLQAMLKKENPQKFSSLNRSDLMNSRRLVRYLEISFSQAKSLLKKSLSPNIKFYWIGLNPGKDLLKTKIQNRVRERLVQGAVKEVKSLLKKYPNHNLPLFSSLGVPQIIKFIDNRLSEEELINAWTKAEIDYAGRQMVWFKKQPGIVWYDNSTRTTTLVGKLKKIYQHYA